MPFIVLLAVCLVTAAASTPTGAQVVAPGALTLPEAFRLAESGNPALRSVRLVAEAASARSEDTSRRPNPSLAASVENFGGGFDADRIESTLEIGLPLELGGDRAARQGLGRALAHSADAEVEVTRRAVLAETAERFLDAWVLQERIARLTEAERFATEAEAAAATRLRAGAAPAYEQVRARGFRVLRTVERRRAESEWAVANRRLALQWGADSVGATSLALATPELASPEAPQLVALVEDHPERRAADAELAIEVWRSRAARAARVPDLSLAAGVRRFGASETGFVTSVSLPLPVWNRMRGTVAAAERERAAAEARSLATRQRLRERVRASHDRYAASLEGWRLIRRDVQPAAEQALELILAGYRAGRLSYLDIQDGQRGLTEAELLLIEATAETWRARVTLELLVGRSIGEAHQEGSER